RVGEVERPDHPAATVVPDEHRQVGRFARPVDAHRHGAVRPRDLHVLDAVHLGPGRAGLARGTDDLRRALVHHRHPGGGQLVEPGLGERVDCHGITSYGLRRRCPDDTPRLPRPAISAGRRGATTASTPRRTLDPMAGDVTTASTDAYPGAFHPAVRTWFERRFGAPTDAQAAGWPHIAAHEDTLLAAPTGSGKTLAAFLVGIDAP